MQRGRNIAPPPFDALLLADTGEALEEIANLLPYYDVSPSVVRIMGPALWALPSSGSGHFPGALYAAPDPAARGELRPELHGEIRLARARARGPCLRCGLLGPRACRAGRLLGCRAHATRGIRWSGRAIRIAAGRTGETGAGHLSGPARRTGDRRTGPADAHPAGRLKQPVMRPRAVPLGAAAIGAVPVLALAALALSGMLGAIPAIATIVAVAIAAVVLALLWARDLDRLARMLGQTGEELAGQRTSSLPVLPPLERTRARGRAAGADHRRGARPAGPYATGE